MVDDVHKPEKDVNQCNNSIILGRKSVGEYRQKKKCHQAGNDVPGSIDERLAG